MVNGEEITNNVKVSTDAIGSATLSAPAIRFKSSQDVEYTAIMNDEDNTVDV